MACTILMHGFASAQINGGKKILIVTTNSDRDLKYNSGGWGCYFPEVVDFYSKVSKYGFTHDDIDVVSLEGGEIPLFEDPFQLPISADDEQKLRNKVKNTLKPSQVDASKYNVIYYAGGISCLVDYPTSDNVAAIAKSIYENGGIVAAVCDGISGLIPIKLSNGKPLVDGIKLTTNDYTEHHGIDVTEELKNKGALPDKSKGVIVDKKVVTGKNVRPVQVATEILKLLNIQFPTSVNDVNVAPHANVYPNPANDVLHINFAGDEQLSGYTISNLNGQILQQANTTQKSIDVSFMQPGSYIIQINTSAGTHSQMITVQH